MSDLTISTPDANSYFDPRSPGSRLSKSQKRQARRAEKAEKESSTRAKPLVGLNATQDEYIEALTTDDQVFAVGGAGTGKTYVAARIGMRKLIAGEVDRIVISRPAVSKAKHKQGFLPGGPDEKIAPWLEPIMDGFRAEVSATTLEKLRKEGKVQFLAFEFMRGRTLRKAFVMLDEAQNCDFGDLRMFLTRIGEESQVVVCGDIDQIDIPDSGFDKVLDMIDAQNLSPTIIEFGPEDVVRSKTAKEWVKAFARFQH